MYMNVATILVVIVELFHLTCHFVSLCSQNDKQDSEMMAVRTADKLLKVSLPLCFFIVFSVHWTSQQTASYFALNWRKHILFPKILERLVAMRFVAFWVLVAGPQRSFNHILCTLCDSCY